MITLIKPSKLYQNEIFDYKEEMIEYGDTELSGCGGLDKHDNYEEWMERILFYQHRETIPEDSGFVEGSQWLLVNTDNNRIVGMVNIRHYLNDHLLSFGGHIGYSIRPSERRKGYATKQLRLALDFLKGLEVKNVLVTCSDNNIGSYKTIEACGGVLENVVFIEEHGHVRRYWINNT